MKLTIKLGELNITNMEHKALSILIGANGSGKTLVHRSTFLLNYLSYNLFKNPLSPNKLNKEMAVDDSVEVYSELINYYANNTYEDFDFTGELGIEYDCGSYLKFSFEDGIVNDLDYDFKDEFKPFRPKYMSSETRLFKAIDAMLKTRKMVLKDNPIDTPDYVIKMQETFKLPDLQLLEDYIHYVPIKVIEKLQNSLNNYVDDNTSGLANIDLIDIDDAKDKFYLIYKDGTKKYLSTLSAGEQAILNIFTYTNLGLE